MALEENEEASVQKTDSNEYKKAATDKSLTNPIDSEETQQIGGTVGRHVNKQEIEPPKIMENTTETLVTNEHAGQTAQDLEEIATAEEAVNEDVSDANFAEEEEFFNILRLDKELINKFKNPFRRNVFKSWKESFKGLVQNTIVDINSLNIILRRLLDDKVFVIIYEDGFAKHREMMTLLSTLREPFQLISTRVLSANECTKEFYECELKALTDPPFVIFEDAIYKNIYELEELLYSRIIPKTIIPNEDQMEENEYDLVIIGNTFGAVYACQEAEKYSKRVLLVNYLPEEKPSVPCMIRVMRSAVKMFETIRLGFRYGFCDTGKVRLNWKDITAITRLNSKKSFFNKKIVLNEKEEVNGRPKFTDNGLLNITGSDSTCRQVKGRCYLIATGSVPRMPNDIIGLKEHAIHIKEVLFLKENPEKTLIIGDSSTCIEIAGILNACEFNVTIVIGSGMHDCQNYEESFVSDIRKCMELRGVKFISDCRILRIRKTDGKFNLVEGLFDDGGPFLEEFKTVAFDFGLVPRTSYLGLSKMNVKLTKSRHIIVDENDRSSNPNVFAIGSVAEGKPVSDSFSQKAAKYFIERIFNYGTKKINYGSIPKLVLAPREYGCVGLTEKLAEQLSEESQIKQKIFVYETSKPPQDSNFILFPQMEVRVKMLCTLDDNEEITIVGLHLLGECIGDLLQGLSILVGTSHSLTRFDKVLSCSLSPNSFLNLDMLRTIPSSTKDLPEANLENLDKLIRTINTGKVGTGKAEDEFNPEIYDKKVIKIEEYDTESDDGSEQQLPEPSSMSCSDSKEDIMEKYKLLVSPLFENAEDNINPECSTPKTNQDSECESNSKIHFEDQQDEEAEEIKQDFEKTDTFEENELTENVGDQPLNDDEE